MSDSEAIVIEACDAKGTRYSYTLRSLDGGIYEYGDAEPILRFANIRDADELRIAVEAFRIGQCIGEKTGRELQKLDFQKALGLIGIAKADGRK